MLPDWARLLLAALTVYRLAQLVTIDTGPGRIFQRLREWAGVYDRGKDGAPMSELGRLLACPYCLGLYLGALVAVLAYFPTRYGDAALLVFGLAGAQAYLQGPRDPE